MKTMMMISLLCLAALTCFAQTRYTTNDHPTLKNNGQRIVVTPAFSEPFTIISEPACYMYKRHGLVVLECPGVLFTSPASLASTESQAPPFVTTDNITTTERSRSFTGNYPTRTNNVNIFLNPARIPSNAVPAWPSTPYVELSDPPCYRYTNKRGLKIMECPGLRLPPANQDN